MSSESVKDPLATRATMAIVQLTDTQLSARAVQVRVQRAMTGEQRLLMALEMSVYMRSLAAEGSNFDAAGGYSGHDS